MVKTRHQRLVSTTPSPGPLPETRKTKKQQQQLTVSDVTSQDDMFCDQTPGSKLTGSEINDLNEDVVSDEESGMKKTEKSDVSDDDDSDNEDSDNDVKIHGNPVVNEITTVVSMETDSDDEAPADISFNESRHSALETIHHALQGVKRSHSKKKEHRRARDDLFKQQKKQKLETIRLSEDLLRKVEEEEKIAQLPLATKSHDADDSSVSSINSNQDVGIHAVTLPNIIHKSKSKSQVAMDFLQKQLYGGRVKRQSVNDMYAQKRKLQGRPAFKFTTSKVSLKKKQRK